MSLTKRSRSTIAEIAGLALEKIPMEFSRTEITPGRKVFFPLPVTKRPRDMFDYIYIFAESRLRHPPCDALAFTREDVIADTGVYVFRRDAANRVCGVTYPVTALFGTVITDLTLQNRIIYRINEMKHMAQLDDEFLDAASAQWSLSKNAEEFGIKRLN